MLILQQYQLRLSKPIAKTLPEYLVYCYQNNALSVNTNGYLQMGGNLIHPNCGDEMDCKFFTKSFFLDVF